MAARWYDTQTGTFTSRDTYPGEIGASVTLNRYSYGNNNPLAYFDPTGRFSIGEVQFEANQFYVPNVDNGVATTSVGQTDSGNTYAYGAQGNMTTGTGNTFNLNSSGNTTDGYSNSTFGSGNSTIGDFNTVVGNVNYTVGLGHTVEGNNNFTIGVLSTVIGNQNLTVGTNNNVRGNLNVLINNNRNVVGNGKVADIDYQTSKQLRSLPANVLVDLAVWGWDRFDSKYNFRTEAKWHWNRSEGQIGFEGLGPQSILPLCFGAAGCEKMYLSAVRSGAKTPADIRKAITIGMTYCLDEASECREYELLQQAGQFLQGFAGPVGIGLKRGLQKSGALYKAAVQAHNLAGPGTIPFNMSTVAIAEVKVPGQGLQLYASGSSGRLSKEQVESLVNAGVPRSNIVQGKLHAEMNILRALPGGSVQMRWGIAWAGSNKPIPCAACGPYIQGVLEGLTGK